MIQATIDGHLIEIPKNIGKYEYVGKIGEGSFSVVVLVTYKSKFYACKVCSRNILVEIGMFERFEQEVRVMQTLNHPNIVKLEDIIFEDRLIFLIMEYCEKGELFNHIVDHGALPHFFIKKLLQQLASALAYIHNHGVVHRDLKPENILFDSNYNAKLVDFGFCQQTSTNQLLSTPCGSSFYASPEIAANEPYDGKKSDMWSLGVVLFIMATGRLPWTEQNHINLLKQITNADYKIPRSVPDDIRQLILMLMTRDPDSRPTAEEFLNVDFFSEVKTPDEGAEELNPDQSKPQDPLGAPRQRELVVRPRETQSCRASQHVVINHNAIKLRNQVSKSGRLGPTI